MDEIQAVTTPRAYNLLNQATNRSQRAFAFVIASIVTLISLIAVPFARVQLAELTAYQPALLSTVICFELLTAYVLYSQFRVSRTPSVLALAAGYLYSGGMTLAYMLTFPHIFSDTGLLGAGLQTAPWLYLLWHLGFAIAIGVYVLLENRSKEKHWSRRKAEKAALLMLTAVSVLVCGLTYWMTRCQDALPVLLLNGHLTPLFYYGLGWPIVAVSLAILIALFVQTRGRTVTSVWLCVALLASLLDVSVVLCGGGRYSVGWYTARWNSFICSNIVLAAMIYEFNRMYLKMTVLYADSQAAQRKISEQNGIIGRMLESSHEAILMCGNDGRVLFANGRFGEFFGRQLVEGQLLVNGLAGMETASGSLGDLIEGYLRGNQEPFREHIRFTSSHGEVRHFECYVNPLSDDQDGQTRGHLFGFRDRTDEERMDEMKNEFVSIISHEIRTPLSSIVGFIEILATRSVMEEKRAKYIEIIQKEAFRLTNLINDFLDLQRLTSGRQGFLFQTLDIGILLKEIVEQWHGTDNHAVELHGPTRRVCIQGDEDRLKQVFHNLLSNAIKYSPGADKIDVCVETENGNVLVKVQDYGLGIPPDALDKLFTRFYRVDNSDRRKIGGTGLGLSIVKEIVDAHHGKIVVDTELGTGSIFIVQLAEQPALEDGTGVDQPEERGDGTIGGK